MAPFKSIQIAVVFIGAALASPLHAAELVEDADASHWACSLAGSASIGEFGSPQVFDQDWRTVEYFAADVFPSYRLGRWDLGLTADLRFQGQITSKNEVNSQNVEGAAAMAGLGARYRVSRLWDLQLNLDGAGYYWYSLASFRGASPRLTQPFAVKIKGQYRFAPQMSLDLQAEGIRWDSTELGPSTLTHPTSEFSIGLGVTYFLGGSTAVISPTSPPPMPGLASSEAAGG